MDNLNQKFDVAVVGGGPAGLMAAGVAAKNGAKVVLLEKNNYLGKKLLLTGKGRCNITNATFVDRDFVSQLGKNGAFFFSGFNAFGPKAVIDFFAHHKVQTKVERGNRVFPVSDKSLDVLNALIEFLAENKVLILKDSPVINLVLENKRIKSLKLKTGEIFANNYIIATGGLSYPKTGSTGDGYLWAKSLGLKLEKPRPALVPILVKEKWLKKLEGLSLKNVDIAVYQNDKKMDSRFGEALFTDNGLSGPIILDLSAKIGSLLETGSVFLKINFKPALDYPTLDKRLQKDLAENKSKAFKNSLDALLPKKLIPIILELSQIDQNKKAGQLTKEERIKLLKLISEFPLTVDCLAGFDKAIVTAGGIDLKEIDPKTMRSKKINNLFFAGEIINLHGPTGGYSLQIAFSTGYLSGLAAAKK
ncbi:MAG: NAD(P)/FAD-dependent oxidoreductase [Candidatus Buchananbacteria bacterium]